MEKDNLTSTFLTLRDKLRRSAMAFLKDDEEAKDAIQDTFFRLWRNGDVKSEPEARNKLFVALRNTCIDKLRKPRTLTLDEADNERFETDSFQFEDMTKYESLLTSGLTDTQRQIYSLIAHRNLEYEEIAELLKMSVEAVRMNMSRARRRIRENLRELEK